MTEFRTAHVAGRGAPLPFKACADPSPRPGACAAPAALGKWRNPRGLRPRTPVTDRTSWLPGRPLRGEAVLTKTCVAARFIAPARAQNPGESKALCGTTAAAYTGSAGLWPAPGDGRA